LSFPEWGGNRPNGHQKKKHFKKKEIITREEIYIRRSLTFSNHFPLIEFGLGLEFLPIPAEMDSKSKEDLSQQQ